MKKKRKDVLLSADIFEKFISTCLKFYGLDPCHYFSSTGLSWDVMLKMTTVKLEKISDIDKHLFIEKGLRGFLTLLRDTLKHNKYLNDYDPKKPSTFITHRIWITCMVGQWLSVFLMVGLSG